MINYEIPLDLLYYCQKELFKRDKNCVKLVKGKKSKNSISKKIKE